MNASRTAQPRTRPVALRANRTCSSRETRGPAALAPSISSPPAGSGGEWSGCLDDLPVARRDHLTRVGDSAQDMLELSRGRDPGLDGSVDPARAEAESDVGSGEDDAPLRLAHGV